MTPQLFDWENFPHNRGSFGAEWGLDFDSTPPRAYKQYDFVTLYNGGPLEIAGNPYRNPTQLNVLRRSFGLDFRLWSDLGDLQLFSPDWEPIRKGGTDLDCVLLDHNHKLVIAPHWDATVIYYSPHSWPSGGRKFKYFVPNRERAKKLKLVLSDVLKLAHTYYTMDGPGTTGPSARMYIDHFLRRGGSLDISPETHGRALRELGGYVAAREIDWHIARWTEDERETTFLRYKVR